MILTLKNIPIKEINKNIEIEKEDLSRYAVGTKEYDKVLKRISFLVEIKRRKLNKPMSYINKEMKLRGVI
jgi:hypothetical protein